MHEGEYQVWVRANERKLRSTPAPPRNRGESPRFSMAFQPIVNVADGTTFAYEALVRSITGESAYSVLSKVPRRNCHIFDMSCRSRAMTVAAHCGLLDSVGSLLCVNVNPNAAIAEASHLRHTFDQAMEMGFPLDRLVLEIVEDDEICDFDELKHTVDSYRACGVKVAMDDFGAGYSGLKLLSKLQPDIIKLDMELVNRVQTDHTSEVIVRAIVRACFELNITTIAEGVEHYDTAMRLRDMGVVYQQGYYFARPMFEQLPTVNYVMPEMQIG